MTLTMTDMFCGAAGSSTGALAVPGVKVRPHVIAAAHQRHKEHTMNAPHLGLMAMKWTRRSVRLGIYLAGATALAIGALMPSGEALALLLLIVFGVQLGTCLILSMNGIGARCNRVRPLVTAVCWAVVPAVMVATASIFIPNSAGADFIQVTLVSVTLFLLASAAIALGSRVVRAHGERGRQVHVARAGEA